MPNLKLFEFTVEIVNRLREQKAIPIDFYNKDGQILIHKKEEATEEEIGRILRFIDQGIYYNDLDSDKLNLREKKEIPDGLTETRLLSKEYTRKLTEHAGKMFDALKTSSSSQKFTGESNSILNGLFEDFANQSDAMSGLVNIIELMKESESPYQVELAVKRSVIAMALKTRGMQAALSHKDKLMHKETINNLMLSAFLCDVGYFRMDMPKELGLSMKQMEYIKNHPLMSYLLVAHDPNVNSKVKHTILIHHSAKYDGVNVNNYPDVKFLQHKLGSVFEKVKSNPSKKALAKNIELQLTLIDSIQPYNEDANIVAIASEFASLTTRVPWREPFESDRAVKMIVNNSYFTYNRRIVREFLDYISISLCDNKMIITEGDFVIVAVASQKEDFYFEVCRVDSIDRLQSRPEVVRFAIIRPIIEKSPKFRFKTFNMENIKPDPRKARYDLNKDDTRFIIYIVDAAYDKELYEGLEQLVMAGKSYVYSRVQKNMCQRPIKGKQ